MPIAVAQEVARVFEAAEKRLNITARSQGKIERAAAVLTASGSVPTPEQYEAAFRARQAKP